MLLGRGTAHLREVTGNDLPEVLLSESSKMGLSLPWLSHPFQNSSALTSLAGLSRVGSHTWDVGAWSGEDGILVGQVRF